jgi:hypothetical protein
VRTPRALASCFLALIASACGSPADTPAARPEATTQPWFTDDAQATGLTFVHENGMTGHRYIAEIMAPGVALFDVDNDGDLDVYIVQGQRLGAAAPDATTQSTASGRPRGDRLFRNDLRSAADGRPLLHFTDVTQQAGIDLQTYGMGVAAGDIDNDGWTDLLITRLSGTVLLKNNGNGTFTDATAKAGLTSSTWSVPASFFDFDRDGWLDLYVGNYIRYSTESDVGCFALTGAPDYCRPQNFATLPGRLYRNQRNGTFADVTVAAGLSREFGPALGEHRVRRERRRLVRPLCRQRRLGQSAVDEPQERHVRESRRPRGRCGQRCGEGRGQHGRRCCRLRWRR